MEERERGQRERDVMKSRNKKELCAERKIWSEIERERTEREREARR